MAWVKEYRIVLLLASLKFILPFLVQDGTYELQRDEYLYLAEAQHLAWGYMEVPPLLSFFARITAVFGNGFFWVKFWPSLFGALTVWTTCSIVREMGGKAYAQFLAGLCIIAG
ncbi:MAG: glycosyl transferase, partial [Chitinophagaceae bacterium]